MLAFLLQIAAFILINVSVVSGLTILYGSCGQVSLAQGAFFGIGAYSLAILTTKVHLNVWIALVCAIAISALFGVLISLPALRLKGHYLAMGTLAFAELSLWFFNEMTPLTGGVDGISNIPHLAAGNISIIIIACGTALVLFVTYRLMKGMPGECMQAIDSNEIGARACGIEIEKIKARSYVFSALCAGFGGALYASFVGFISPSLFASSASIMFLAMAVIGSRNSFKGPIFAVIILTLVQYCSSVIPLPSETIKSFVSSVQVDLYALLIIGITLYQARRGEDA